ncbi:tyrosine-type recombinase/integrase [uncultured Methylobacterium sp.]|uniref:tyrosine-type recombinase/integrase n=1 Tax=uncultured Methylobacterium sp. TaxID=157278 RepID=UPI002618BE1E|nr:tyrosine-type recombinase/integrase [uncultured Methylobacterium sp.]
MGHLEAMSRIKLKYVDSFTDRYGVRRFYFRRTKADKRVLLPGLPGSDAFMSAYQLALDGRPPAAAAPADPQVREIVPCSFDALVARYFASPEFLALKAPTRKAYRLAIERIVKDDKIGPMKVDTIRREHIKAMMAKRADRPSSANDTLKKLRILLKFAIDISWRRDDPTIGMKKFKEGEHHTWTEAEIADFEGRWAAGSVQRTAFALLLYTGQRVSDVAGMSWRDVNQDGTAIHVTQDKTGTKLWIPIHPDLMTLLNEWPRHSATDSILYTEFGKAFTAKGFGNKMADAIGAAKLPEECVSHGIRKAASRRLAEAGCTAHEIASITGHKSLSEVERYTKAASQKVLSEAGIAKLRAKVVPNSVP